MTDWLTDQLIDWLIDLTDVFTFLTDGLLLFYFDWLINLLIELHQNKWRGFD